jgi:ATP phosphoribosyltransferase regulatory subunit HisZ
MRSGWISPEQTGAEEDDEGTQLADFESVSDATDAAVLAAVHELSLQVGR